MNTYSYEDVKTFEDIIGNNYKDYRIDTNGVLKEACEKLTYDEIKDMLSDSVNSRQHDGRISDLVKRWAIESPKGEHTGINRVHPGLLDLICRDFIEFENALIKNASRSDFYYFPQKEETKIECGNLSMKRSFNDEGKMVDTYSYMGKETATVISEENEMGLFEMATCLEYYRKENDLDYGRDPVEEIAEKNKIDVAVVVNVNDYLRDVNNSLTNYKLIDVCPKSNHPDDNYLYMVTGKNTVTGEFAVWTSWNESTQSLNNGHYNLAANQIEDVLNEYFHNGYEAFGITKDKARDIDYVNEVVNQARKGKHR